MATSEVKIHLLLVDDDSAFCTDLAALLKDRYRLKSVASRDEALRAVHHKRFDAVLLDLDLGRGDDGFEVLETLKSLDPDLPVIMVTRDATAASAVTALKRGAADYIDKRPDLQELERRIERALAEQRLVLENRLLREEIAGLKGQMVGNGPAMLELRQAIQRAAVGSSPVLITGETGTGKELVARALHAICCPAGPFVGINCAALPAGLFESQLFGAEKGSFTGSERRTVGAFELAMDGLLFLDEISEIDKTLQAKLLRVIEERQFTRLGGGPQLQFRGRIVASTNRDPVRSMEDGTLRTDLFYRFSAFVLAVPPLRNRREDIPLLVEYFLQRKVGELKRSRPIVTQGMLERLCAHEWPGNVRELENVLEGLVAGGSLGWPLGFPRHGETADQECLLDFSYEAAKAQAVRRFQDHYVPAILSACGNDVTAAAHRMGISRQGLANILHALGSPPAKTARESAE